MVTVTCNTCGKQINIHPIIRVNAILAAFINIECGNCAKQKLLNSFTDADIADINAK